MLRIFAACAAFVLVAAPAAHASFGTGSFAVSSNGASAKAETPNLFEVLVSAFSFNLIVKAAPPSRESSEASGTAALYECEESKKAEAEQAEEKEARNTRTGDPVYLAF